MRALLALVILFASVLPSFAGEKLIALTFDDGPKPYVLYGLDEKAGVKTAPGLIAILSRFGIRGTFFVMGWKLAANEINRRSVRDLVSRGHAVENHTYGHGPFRNMAAKYGENWVLQDIERAAALIKRVTGVAPCFVRPPEWSIWNALKIKIESRICDGVRKYRVATKSTGDVRVSPLLADVDTEDYRHYEKDPARRPACALYDCVLQKIEARERAGLYGHILVFHELPLTAEVLSWLIPELQRMGYRFVTLAEYMNLNIPTTGKGVR